jgi:hypothetical protein
VLHVVFFLWDLRRLHASQPKQFGRVCACIMMTFCDVFVSFGLFWHTTCFLEASRSLCPFIDDWSRVAILQ